MAEEVLSRWRQALLAHVPQRMHSTADNLFRKLENEFALLDGAASVIPPMSDEQNLLANHNSDSLPSGMRSTSSVLDAIVQEDNAHEPNSSLLFAPVHDPVSNELEPANVPPASPSFFAASAPPSDVPPFISNAQVVIENVELAAVDEIKVEPIEDEPLVSSIDMEVEAEQLYRSALLSLLRCGDAVGVSERRRPLGIPPSMTMTERSSRPPTSAIPEASEVLPAKRRKVGRPKKMLKKASKRAKNARFACPSSLASQNGSAHASGGYECRHCCEVFPLIAELEKHARRAHPDVRPFGCARCAPLRFYCTRRDLLDHLRNHATLSRHYRCPLCPYASGTKVRVRLHLKRRCEAAHGLEPLPSPIRNREASSIPIRHLARKGDATTLKCAVCLKAFTRRRKGILIDHLKRHNRATLPLPRCPHCRRAFVDTNLRSHLRGGHCAGSREALLANGVEPYRYRAAQSHVCERCGEQLASEYLYSAHLRAAHGVVFMRCITCGNEFTTKQQLARHMRVVHAAVHPLRCPACPTTMVLPARMRRHIRRNCKAAKRLAAERGVGVDELEPLENVVPNLTRRTKPRFSRTTKRSLAARGGEKLAEILSGQVEVSKTEEWEVVAAAAKAFLSTAEEHPV